MKQVCFDYAENFHCLAGNCPDTCCKDWQIILDPETIEKYRTVEGELGEKLKSALVTEDGETMFRLEHGHCVLLRPDGLCPVQAELGEQALCHTCYTHPRFIEEYGATQELTLSLSCPGAARLLLQQQTPLQLVTSCNDESVSAPNELDAELYLALLQARKTAFVIAQDRTLPIRKRLGLELLFATQVQDLLDARKENAVGTLCKRFARPTSMARQLARAQRCGIRRAQFFPCWMVLNNMEHLTGRFTRLLDAAALSGKGEDLLSLYPAQAENLLCYFLFRYFLKAVNDRQLLARVQSCVFHVLSIRELFRTDEKTDFESLLSLASLYSKEVEHSEENLQLLLRVFQRGTLHSAYLLSLLR
ncbi:MAG: flagellin lysine-N-methylase [Clostridia bacterium]|nr:flagellin lysine-N-methylase [Clostridia bacterium]